MKHPMRGRYMIGNVLHLELKIAKGSSCEILAKARTKKHCLWSSPPLLALQDQFTNIGFLLVVHLQLKCFGRILTRDFKSNTLITVLPRYGYSGLSLILNGRQYCLNINKEFRDVVITSSVTDQSIFQTFQGPY